jgi:hypothetical protein
MAYALLVVILRDIRLRQSLSRSHPAAAPFLILALPLLHLFQRHLLPPQDQMQLIG